MKKIDHPNQGHLVPDYFVDGIARVYATGASIAIVFETPTGIETHNAILKNECLRLVVPIANLEKLYQNLGDICNAFVSKEKQANVSIVESHNTEKNKEILSQPFMVGD